MYQGRIVEILIILMGEIKKSGMEQDNMELLSEKLLNCGYSEQEISTAFSWVIERLEQTGEASSPDPESFRVLHDIEHIFISNEAYGFLIQLSYLGLLTYEEFEKVIESVLLASIPRLDMEGMKSIIGEVLLGEAYSDAFGGEIFLPDDLVQ